MEQALDPERTLCFTGHRTLPEEDREPLAHRLDQALAEAWDHGYRQALCGGAIGFDLAAGEATIQFRETHPAFQLVMALPCGNQAEKWPRRERERYDALRARADAEIILAPTYYDGCMLNRNRYMVDHASLCICYLWAMKGGTWFTVRYAAQSGLKVVNLARSLA